MLTPEQIEALSVRAEQISDSLTDFLISDIAERIAEAGQLTSTASYEVWRVQNLGVSQKQLKKELAKRLKVSLSQVDQLLTQAAEVGYNYDISRFPTLEGIPFAENTTLQQIVRAAVELAEDDFTNIVQTIGFVGPDGGVHELTQAYQQACDFAFQKTATGAQDFHSAVRAATRNLAVKGIRYIDYESGVHTSMEAAVRRCVMGGLGLMQEKISQENHDYLGCDGWEISAHAASAPDHEPIQGRQYTDAEYTRLNNSLVRRIGTLNCGHAAFPIILGVNEPQYTEAQLEKFRQDNEEGVTFDGVHYTGYEATQRQRKFERSIRTQKRKILVDEATGDKDKLQTDQIRLQRLKQEYKRFSDGTGLRVQHERLETAGFDWKKAKAAEKAMQERVASVGESAASLNWHRIPVSGGQTDTLYRKLTSEVVDDKSGKTMADQIIDRNVKSTNPGYKNGGAPYRQNCQRCVAAYEMRRRGYDVIARPAIVGEDGKLSSKDPLYSSWKSIFEGAKFTIHSGYDGGKAGIIAQMDECGDGAVAEVRVLWNASEAHVFIAERVNGAVRFVDPQNGEVNCEKYFTDAVIGATMIARIDNLQPTELITKCIKNRGGKA